jgi:hypothetical protein
VPLLVLLLAPVLYAGEAGIVEAFSNTSGRIQLPRGTHVVDRELRTPDGVEDVHISGHPEGTVLRASRKFEGKAIIVIRSAKRVTISGLSIDGNGAGMDRHLGIAPYDRTFASFYDHNGILAERVDGLTIRDVRLRQIASFAILVNASNNVVIENVEVRDSGALNAHGRNNTSGGILLEEGTTDFLVRKCIVENVPGNGVWTHSLYTSPRQRRGRISENHFANIGRDAIQVGHATEIRVEYNTGWRIGYPVRFVDAEGRGIPVAIDTAGNVDKTVYAGNSFREVNGKCIDLDGFHNGEVRGNTCRNLRSGQSYPFGQFGISFNNTNPDMESQNIVVTENLIDGAKYGGMFVIGNGHTISRNRLLRLNLAGCTAEIPACLYDPAQPDFLLAGIYLAAGAERPANTAANSIVDNVVSGYGMDKHCITAAAGVRLTANEIARNECRDPAP